MKTKDNQNVKFSVKAMFLRDHKNSFVYSLVNPSQEVKDFLDKLAAAEKLRFRHIEEYEGQEHYVFYKSGPFLGADRVIKMTMTYKPETNDLGFWVAGSKVSDKIATLTSLVESTENDKVGNALASGGASQILAMAGFTANMPTTQPAQPTAQPTQEQPVQEADMTPE